MEDGINTDALEAQVGALLKAQGITEEKLAQMLGVKAPEVYVDPDDERAAKKRKLEDYREELVAEGSSFAVDALKTISIHMVNGPYNASFHPEFAHQMFGDAEVIVGYCGLRIDVYYHGATLESFVDIMWEKNKPQVKHWPSGDEENEVTSLSVLIPADDIKEKMHLAFPHDVIFQEDRPRWQVVLDRSYLSYTPPGKRVHTYLAPNGVAFEVYSGSTSEMEDLRNIQMRAQTFPFYFIDGASTADYTDSRWHVFHLYARESGGLVFAGFLTAFVFTNMLRQVRPDSLRICQVLILPPYQRLGHGKHLVQCAYNLANDIDAFEITVEDPAPAFSALRDVTDLKLCLSLGLFVKDIREDAAWSIDNDKLVEVQGATRLTITQILRTIETLKLRCINVENEEQYKAYRLQVKGRLHKLHRESLMAIEDKEQRKGELQTLFAAEEGKYKTTLTKVADWKEDL